MVGSVALNTSLVDTPEARVKRAAAILKRERAEHYASYLFEHERYQQSYHKVVSVRGTIVTVESLYNKRSESNIGEFYHITEVFKLEPWDTLNLEKGQRLDADSFESLIGTSTLLSEKCHTRSP